MRQRAGALILLLAAMCGSLRAVDVNLGTAGIQRAIALAGQPASTRAAFHHQYIVTTGDPVVGRFEVTTELRRLVRAIEERQRHGKRSFRVQDAYAVLQEWRGRVAVAAHLRFHPSSALVTVPRYELLLRHATDREPIRPLEVRRQALDGPPAGLPAVPAPGAFLRGAIVEAVFEALPIAGERLDAVLMLNSDELARAAIDFAQLD
jgi:hypothetical protein